MTEPADHDLVVLLKKLRYDLTAMQAKVSDALNLAARLELPSPQAFVCQSCGIDMRAAAKLAEHLYHSHDGPLPAHYADAEARAADTDPTFTKASAA